MIYQRPFVTSRFTAYAGDSQTRTLSLAVRLVDDFTGLPPEAAVRVFLKERGERHRRGDEPVTNLSGYRCFLDLPDGTYTLVAQPDPVAAGYDLKPDPGQPWSSDFERSVDIPRPDTKQPVVEIRLAPNTGYPFPAHATLVQGRVMSGGAPVAGADLSAKYLGVDPDDFDNAVEETARAQTDGEGFFVLYFKVPSLTPQNIDVIAKANGLEKSKTVALKEGETTSVETIPLP